MSGSGDPDEIAIGPGWIYVAPIATADPTSGSAALPSAWRCLGYTEDGNTFTIERSFEDIEVAEELEPVDEVNNKTTNKVALQLAQATRQNMAWALGLGADAAQAGYIEPPAPGAEVFFKMVWDSDTDPAAVTNARFLWRRCKVTGNIEMAHKKSPAKTLLPVEVMALKPTGATSWRAWPNNSKLIA